MKVTRLRLRLLWTLWSGRCGLSPHRGKKRSGFHTANRRLEMWQTAEKVTGVQGCGRSQESHVQGCCCQFWRWVVEQGQARMEEGQGHPDNPAKLQKFGRWSEAYNIAMGQSLPLLLLLMTHEFLAQLGRDNQTVSLPFQNHVWISPTVHRKIVELTLRAYSYIYIRYAKHLKSTLQVFTFI